MPIARDSCLRNSSRHSTCIHTPVDLLEEEKGLAAVMVSGDAAEDLVEAVGVVAMDYVRVVLDTPRPVQTRPPADVDHACEKKHMAPEYVVLRRDRSRASLNHIRQSHLSTCPHTLH